MHDMPTRRMSCCVHVHCPSLLQDWQVYSCDLWLGIIIYSLERSELCLKQLVLLYNTSAITATNIFRFSDSLSNINLAKKNNSKNTFNFRQQLTEAEKVVAKKQNTRICKIARDIEKTKFPPSSPTKVLMQKIVRGFCESTSRKKFEESGCAVCGRLNLVSKLKSMEDVAEKNAHQLKISLKKYQAQYWIMLVVMCVITVFLPCQKVTLLTLPRKMICGLELYLNNYGALLMPKNCWLQESDITDVWCVLLEECIRWKQMQLPLLIQHPRFIEYYMHKCWNWGLALSIRPLGSPTFNRWI